MLMDRELTPTPPYSQGKKKRQHGTDAIKSHIVAAKTVANIVKSSLVRFELRGWMRRGIDEAPTILIPTVIGTTRPRQDPHLPRW